MLCFSAAAAVGQTAPAYKIVVNHAPPYRIIEGNGGDLSFAGLYIDIIREASKRAGLEIEFIEVPFARALKLMEIGHADIMLGPNRTKDREVYMTYLAAELPKETKAFYLLSKAPDIRDYDDLLTRLVFVLNGASYFAPFDTDQRISKVYFNDYVTALNALRSRPNATVIIPEQQGDYLLQVHRLHREKASFQAPGKTSYITVSKKSPLHEDRERLEQALLEMAADGTFDMIIGRYK